MSAAFGLYRAGTSRLHRLPAGAKLAGLAAAGAGSVLVDTPTQATAAVATALSLYPLGRIPVRVIVDMLRPLLWVLVPLTVFQVLFIGWNRTVVLVGVILALVLVANLVTLTTRTTDLIDVVVPLLVRALNRADDMGDALAARGFGD